MPAVSLIIPAYNAEAYLKRALACARNQTEHDLQIVVVDDGSTDNTLEIAQQAAAEDQRITIVQHRQNRGRLEARRSGILAATADFTLFLDADDELDYATARICLDAQAGTYDIVQFSFDVDYGTPVSDEIRQRDLASFAAPVDTAFGENVAHVTFRDRKGSWNLCGKFIRTDLLRTAAGYVAEARMDAAEDACLYFIASCLAKSFCGLPDQRLYLYHMGLSGSDATWSDASMQRFEIICRYRDAMACARSFLDSAGLWEAHGRDFAALNRWHIHTVALRLLDLPAADHARAFDTMAASWGGVESIAALEEVIWGSTRTKLEGLDRAQALQVADAENAPTPAALYSGKSGLLTVLEGNGQIATIAPAERGWPDSFADHALSLAHALTKSNVKRLVIEEADEHFAPWDVLVARACGVQATLTTPEGASLEAWGKIVEYCCAADEQEEGRSRRSALIGRLARATRKFALMRS